MSNQEAVQWFEQWLHNYGEGFALKELDFLTAYKAKEALKEKEERENPKPLTVEELKRMGREPIWFENPTGMHGKHWTIVIGHNDVACELNEYGVWPWSAYGRVWIAYKYKPKEGEQK